MTMVSELLATKIENTILKLQQLQGVADQLTTAQAALVEEARQEVGAPATHVYHPTTKQFQPPMPRQAFSAPTRREQKRAKG